MSTFSKTSILAAVGSLTLAILPTTGLAVDYSQMSTDELLSLRGTLSGATAEERAAYRAAMQDRVQQMSPEEWTEYDLGPRAGAGAAAGGGGGPGDGSRPRPQDGTGFGPGDGTFPQPMDGTGFGAGGRGAGGGRGGGPRR
jgi:hypothetical protein